MKEYLEENEYLKEADSNRYIKEGVGEIAFFASYICINMYKNEKTIPIFRGEVIYEEELVKLLRGL